MLFTYIIGWIYPSIPKDSGYKYVEKKPSKGRGRRLSLCPVRSALLALIFLLLRRLRMTALPSSFADFHTHTEYIYLLYLCIYWRFGNSGVCVIFSFIVNRFAHILGIYLLLCELQISRSDCDLLKKESFRVEVLHKEAQHLRNINLYLKRKEVKGNGEWFTTIFGIWFAPFHSFEKSIELSSFSLVKQPSMYVCLAFIRQSNQANLRETHHSCSSPHFVCLSNLRRRKFCCSFMNLGSRHSQTQIHRWKLSNFLWEPERERVCVRES